MTIGKFPDLKSLNKAYDEIKDLNYIFETVVKKISVEMINENGKSIKVFEKMLK